MNNLIKTTAFSLVLLVSTFLGTSTLNTALADTSYKHSYKHGYASPYYKKQKVHRVSHGLADRLDYYDRRHGEFFYKNHDRHYRPHGHHHVYYHDDDYYGAIIGSGIIGYIIGRY